MNRRAPYRPIRVLLLIFLLLCSVLLSGCGQEATYEKFTRRAAGVFDTEISLTGFAPSEEKFNAAADRALEMLREYNQIFDGYNEYEGLHNLWYVNRHAASGPVEIPAPLYSLLSWCRDKWLSGQKTVNVAMGAVLSIWHDYRTAGLADPENAQLPPLADLQAASAHTDFSDVVLDAEKHTVFFSDPALKIDVGAVAKGYAADLVSDYLKKEMPSFLLSLGGNVYAGEKPLDGRDAWAVGVQDPRMDMAALLSGGTDILDILDVTGLSVVTSGDYWRYYFVDGQRYHHIIDPGTLMPSDKMLSVSIVCDNSLLADYLSTTLFILSYEEGSALISQMEGVEAMWVLPDGEILCSPGMERFARSLQK